MEGMNISKAVDYIRQLQKESVGTFSQIQLNCKILLNDQTGLSEKAKGMVKSISELAANYAKLLYGEL